MWPINSCLLVATLFLVFSGCAPNANTLLLFGQTQTLGVTINGSTTQQGAELTLGYRDLDIAIVPVTVAPQGGGNIIELKADATGTQKDVSHDALSVLGQFNANVTSSSPGVGLGKFFATGLAAKRLADGFAHQLGAPASDAPAAAAPAAAKAASVKPAAVPAH